MDGIIESKVYYSISIGGKSIPFITDAVVNMWIIVAALMLIIYLLTKKLKTIPTGGQNLAEIGIEFINNLANNQIGPRGKNFAAYLGVLLMFIIMSNIIAIFNIIPGWELHPPTKNFNVTLFMALASVFIVIGTEFKYKGLKGWLRSFYKPTPISAFIKLLDYVVRPMSLCLRLFGNIMGGLIVMTLLYSTMPFLAPAVIGIYFDLFDGVLQAYVFVFLTSIYIGEAVETEETEEIVKA